MIMLFPHDAMIFSNSTHGDSMKVEGNRLDAKWLAQDNTVKDPFNIKKNANTDNRK